MHPTGGGLRFCAKKGSHLKCSGKLSVEFSLSTVLVIQYFNENLLCPFFSSTESVWHIELFVVLNTLIHVTWQSCGRL